MARFLTGRRHWDEQGRARCSIVDATQARALETGESALAVERALRIGSMPVALRRYYS